MKILFLVYPFHKGKQKFRESHSLTVLGLQKEMKKLGHEVDILETKKWFPKLNKDYDIVHGFSSAPIKAWRTAFAGEWAKAATVHTIKSISPHKWAGGYKFAKSLKLVDKVTVPLVSMKEKLVEKGVPKDRIEIIHSNIDTKKFKPKKVAKTKQFKGKPLIFYWGALWPEKGVDDLIDAAELLPSYHFVIIPRYDIFWELKNYEKAKNLPNVHILKSSTDIVKYLHMCDLVILPYRTLTRTEANPSCLLEAWTARKPVITTHHKEWTDFVWGKAFLANPNDVSDLAKVIATAFKNKSLLKRMAQMGNMNVDEFDHENIAKHFLNLYNVVMSSKQAQMR